jgi:transcriptional regulator with XRE-family HTH domain
MWHPAPVTTDEKLGRTVHALMWDRHVTNRALAARLGLDESTVARKLRGNRKWTLDEVARVAGVLGVMPADLLPDWWTPQGASPQPAAALPHLDSNQKPIGLLAPVVDLFTRETLEIAA